ncbi:MAG: hypothetical protein ACRBF0_03945 [Calditrichia bacterium]
MQIFITKINNTWQWLTILLQSRKNSMLLSFLFIGLLAGLSVASLYYNLKPVALIILVAGFLFLLSVIIINIYVLLTEHIWQARQFFNFMNASRKISSDIDRDISASGYSRIQVISISGFDEWKFINDKIFNNVGKLGLHGTLDVDFVLSDVHFLNNEDQTGLANAALSVCTEIEKQQKRFSSPSSRIKLNVHKVRHLPPIHGILLSGRVLYTGDYDWYAQNRSSVEIEESSNTNEAIPQLTPKQADYKRYYEKANQNAAMTIENFVCWFNYFVRQANNTGDQASGSQSEDPAPPPQPDEQQEPETAETEKPFEHLDGEPGTADNPVE